MYLSRHSTAAGPRWALDGRLLPQFVTLGALLELSSDALQALLAAVGDGAATEAPLLAPVDEQHEVWAAGVTYLRSREAREAESSVADVYAMVYQAERPELFLKATGARVVAPGAAVAIRPDSSWDVPEPEIVLVINSHGQIVGYTAGNDMSSRSIEGENPLYLPQAKIYDDSCALGPGIVLAAPDELRELAVTVAIERDGELVFSGESGATQMKRSFEELAAYLGRALSFRYGALLMTGTGIVPPESFSLRDGDVVTIEVGALTLRNPVYTLQERNATWFPS